MDPNTLNSYKLYEVGYTTFVKNVAAVYKASRNILIRSGALSEGSQKAHISSCSQLSSEKKLQLLSDQFSEHSPFTNCISSSSWFKRDSDGSCSCMNEGNDMINDNLNNTLNDDFVLMM